MRSLHLSRRPKIETGRVSKMAAEQAGGMSFRGFIPGAFPGWNWYPFNEIVVQRFQDLLDEKLILPDGSVADKLFVHMRYQAGKSLIVQLFCAFCLLKYPGIVIGVAMHGLGLATEFSEKVRGLFLEAGGQLATKNVMAWKCQGDSIDTMSRFWVASKGVKVAGRSADLLVGDDLMGGEADAHHAGQFRKDKSWFSSEFYTRERVHKCKALGRFLNVLINTRQGCGDLPSYWLWLGGWFAVILPTLYDPDTWPIGLPVGPFPAGDGESVLPDKTIDATERNSVVEMDFRDGAWRGAKAKRAVAQRRWVEAGNSEKDFVGEDVGQELESSLAIVTAVQFQARRAVNGGHQSDAVVSANEQGNPKPPAGGGIFHRAWTPYVPFDPKWEWSAMARAWDWAATEGGGDWTASVLMGVTGGLAVVLHACRGRKDAAGVVQLMAAMAILDGATVTIALPQGQGEGKLTFAGMRNDVIRLLNQVGAPIPPFRAMSVRTHAHSDAFRSAKEQRFGQPGGFAVTARPPQWDWKDKDRPIDVPGGIVLCENYEIWDEGRAKMLAGPVQNLARAAAGHLQTKECEALNICPGPGLRVSLDEWHEFGGFGTADHYVDAGADVIMAVRRPVMLPTVY